MVLGKDAAEQWAALRVEVSASYAESPVLGHRHKPYSHTVP